MKLDYRQVENYVENLVCWLVGFPLRRFAPGICIIHHVMKTQEKYKIERCSFKAYIMGDLRVWVCSKSKLLGKE